MASQKSKTALGISAGILFLVLFLGGVGFFIYIVMAPVVRQREAAQMEKKNPVEYHVLHTPAATDVDELKSEMVGTWQLAGTKSRRTRQFVILAPGNYFYKTFTLTNWAIVTYDAQSNVVYSAGGPYTLAGDAYTETIANATGQMKQYLGDRPQYRIRVDGDKYYQMGAGRNPSIEEMWQRVGP